MGFFWSFRKSEQKTGSSGIWQSPVRNPSGMIRALISNLKWTFRAWTIADLKHSCTSICHIIRREREGRKRKMQAPFFWKTSHILAFLGLIEKTSKALMRNFQSQKDNRQETQYMFTHTHTLIHKGFIFLLMRDWGHELKCSLNLKHGRNHSEWGGEETFKNYSEKPTVRTQRMGSQGVKRIFCNLTSFIRII